MFFKICFKYSAVILFWIILTGMGKLYLEEYLIDTFEIEKKPTESEKRNLNEVKCPSLDHEVEDSKEKIVLDYEKVITSVLPYGPNNQLRGFSFGYI